LSIDFQQLEKKEKHREFLTLFNVIRKKKTIKLIFLASIFLNHYYQQFVSYHHGVKTNKNKMSKTSKKIIKLAKYAGCVSSIATATCNRTNDSRLATKHPEFKTSQADDALISYKSRIALSLELKSGKNNSLHVGSWTKRRDSE
jgi:hypothetical protein